MRGLKCFMISCEACHFISLVVNIASVVIGTQYNNVCTSHNVFICDMEKSCNIEIIPQFLQISGGIMIGFAALNLFCAMCCGCGDEEEGNIRAFIMLILTG